MKKMQKRIQRGFTLVELVIVIAIIAILAALLVPSLLSQSDKAKITRATADVNEIAKALARMRTDTGRTDSTCLSLESLPAPTSATTGAAATSTTAAVAACGTLATCSSGATGNCWGGPYMTTVSTDPWSSAYVVTINADTAMGPLGLVTVRSNGAQAANTATADDITSKAM